MSRAALVLAAACAALPLSAPRSSADPVLRTDSGICHCPGGAYYDGITRGEEHQDLASCLATGAREPKRGQGDCSAARPAETRAAQDEERAWRAPARQRPGSDYRREAFGDGWGDADQDCMNTRHETLAQLSTGPVRLSTNGCSVVRGRWLDPYTGMIFTDPGRMDIDHVVPLSYAWRHGADAWTDERREAFANDPVNLMAVDAGTNRQKSDSGPLEWLPPSLGYRCEYVLRFVRIASSYGLSMPAAEAAGIDAIRAHWCG